MAKYKITEQDKLIGNSCFKSEYFYNWLVEQDMPASDNKKHRKLSEIDDMRSSTIEQLSKWIITHHISEKKITRINRKKEILEEYQLDKYLKNADLLPTVDKVRKGNCAEIILAEYLRYASGIDLLVYRLRYNPNVEQSMKGDDVLLLNKEDFKNKIIIGEAKYRSTPNKAVIDEITDSFKDDKKYPLSIPFIIKILEDEGNDDLAEKLEDLMTTLHELKTQIVNVGFLLSNIKAGDIVEKNASSDNKMLVYISLGIEDSEELINSAYETAIRKIKE